MTDKEHRDMIEIMQAILDLCHRAKISAAVLDVLIGTLEGMIEKLKEA